MINRHEFKMEPQKIGGNPGGGYKQNIREDK